MRSVIKIKVIATKIINLIDIRAEIKKRTNIEIMRPHYDTEKVKEVWSNTNEIRIGK